MPGTRHPRLHRLARAHARRQILARHVAVEPEARQPLQDVGAIRSGVVEPSDAREVDALAASGRRESRVDVKRWQAVRRADPLIACTSALV